MNAKNIKELQRDGSITDALIAMYYSGLMMDDYIGDMQSELRSARKTRKLIDRRFKKGKELYKQKHGKEFILKVK